MHSPSGRDSQWGIHLVHSLNVSLSDKHTTCKLYCTFDWYVWGRQSTWCYIQWHITSYLVHYYHTLRWMSKWKFESFSPKLVGHKSVRKCWTKPWVIYISLKTECLWIWKKTSKSVSLKGTYDLYFQWFMFTLCLATISLGVGCWPQ